MTLSQYDQFPTLGPWGLPVTPALSLILTYFLDEFVTPDRVFGISSNQDKIPDEAAAKYEEQLERAELAAKNLRQNMPLFIFSTCVALSSGVNPSVQNLCHLVWFSGRVLYKWACIKDTPSLTGILLIVTNAAVYSNLMIGFRIIRSKC